MPAPGMAAPIFQDDEVVACSFVGTRSSTANQNRYTFTNQSLGAEAGDRLTILAINMDASSFTDLRPLEVTVGGVALAQAAFAGTSGGATAIFYGRAAGATATVEIACHEEHSAYRCGVEVYRMAGQQSDAPYDTATGGNTTDLYIDVPAAGAAVGTFRNGSSFNPVTWTGLTEDSDYAIESMARYGAAHGNFADAQQNLNVHLSQTAAQFAAASWR